MSATSQPGPGQGPGNSIGTVLALWLQQLDAAGFRVGVRERLLVQAHLAQRAATNQWAGDAQSVLAGVAPLLCTSPAQQARYAELLPRFVLAQEDGDAATVAAEAARHRPVGLLLWWSRPHAPALVALAAAILALGLLAWLVCCGLQQPPPPPPLPLPLPSQLAASAVAPAAVSQTGVLVVARPLVVQPALQQRPAWAGPLRTGLIGLAVLATLALAWAAWQRRRRQAVLAQTRTPDAVDEHLLQAGERIPLRPHPALARSVVRALRQRVAGEVQVLDTAATLRATVRAAGALSPRWRSQNRTPEYLVLVDRRHPRDHTTRHQLDLLAALADVGLGTHVWLFEGSPEHGCWPLRASDRQPLRTAFGELAARHAGQRLLVCGDAVALQDPASGAPRAWARALPLLAEQAWLTPLPLSAWGAAEDAVSAQGFLLLPAQAGALVTLAGWLTSERAALSVPPDWPLAYPALLRDDPLSWVSRALPPPPAEFDALMFQLRSSLGVQRHAWLCGCAVFPALSPTLTLALGREALQLDSEALALGYTALAALPWFRYGRMPDWLRERLLDDLPADQQPALRAVIDKRLAQALQATPGDEMASVATQRQRAWLHQADGAAQDVLLAQFLDAGQASRLMQRLPQPLLHALFRDGLPLRGPRPLVWALAALAVLPGLWAASPAWPGFDSSVPQPALAAVGPVLNPPDRASRRGGQRLAFSPDGRLLVGDITSQFEPRLGVWDARSGLALALPGVGLDVGVQPEQQTDALHPLGSHRAVVDGQGRVLLQDPQGLAVGAPLALAGGPAVALAFSPDGQRLAVRMADASVQVYGAAWGTRLEMLACDSVTLSATSVVGNVLVETLDDTLPATPTVIAYTETAWRNLHGRVPPPPGQLANGPGAQRLADQLARRASVVGATGQTPLDRIYQALQTVRRDETLGDAVVFNTCNLPQADPAVAANVRNTRLAPYPPAVPQVPGLSAAQLRQIDDLVAALFAGGDAAQRRATAQALLRDPALFSDAVPLALARASALTQGEAPPGVDADNGIYNALVLAKAAWPATLQRVLATLQALAPGAARQGERTAALAQLALGEAQRAQGSKPRVWVQIPNDAQQRPLANQVLAVLRSRGIDAPGIEVVASSKAPRVTELRAQGLSDRRLGFETAQALAGVLGAAPTLTRIAAGKGINNDTYELWLDPALCAQGGRHVPACGKMTPPPLVPLAEAPQNGAPSAAPTPTAAASAASAAKNNANTGEPLDVLGLGVPQQQQQQQQPSRLAARVTSAAANAAASAMGLDFANVPVRIVVCEPRIRAPVLTEGLRAAQQVRQAAVALGHRVAQDTRQVAAEDYTMERGRGLTITYTGGSWAVLTATKRLAFDSTVRSLGFSATEPAIGAKSDADEIVLTICGLPNSVPP